MQHHSRSSESPITVPEICDIMKQIAAGVTFIHGHGKVHRDLKPRNGTFTIRYYILSLVLYSNQEKSWKIADFGLTCEGTSKGFHTTSFSRGTEGYRSPELVKDHKLFNNKSDIWAMGCILYEIVTEEKAFTNNWTLIHYALSDPESREKVCIPPEILLDEQWKDRLSGTLDIMLDMEPSNRPTASELFQIFSEFYVYSRGCFAGEVDESGTSLILLY